MRAAPAGVRLWWAGARPRTLGAGVVPVLVGTAAAGRASAWRTAAALAVALGLQVGVNFANDHADGVRGVDSSERKGPVRLVASGLASPRSVALAAALSFAAAAGAGLALALATTPWLLALGTVAIAAAWGYSAGPRPYGGLGLGELSVFAFFGLLAVCGTAYVQAGRVPEAAWWSSVPIGLLAAALLVANNLRDVPTDEAAGKRTLAVRLGEDRTRPLYAGIVAAAFTAVAVGVAVGGLPAAALASGAALPLAVRPLRLVRTASGRALVGALGGTAALHAAFGVLLAAGLWVG